jgi:hypothetical protein
MPLVGFEPMISVFELAKTVHTLDRAAGHCNRPHLHINESNAAGMSKRTTFSSASSSILFCVFSDDTSYPHTEPRERRPTDIGGNSA